MPSAGGMCQRGMVLCVEDLPVLCRDTVKTIITLRIKHLFKMDAS